MSACNPINHKGLIYLGGGQKNERFSSNTIYKYCPNIDK